MPFSGDVAIRVMNDSTNKYQAAIYPGTTAGLQAAIDSLAGGKGKVKIGPGTLETTTAIWLHSGCHIEGCGIGQTIVKRSAMADGDAANSGAVFAVSPFGANGTLCTSGTSASDISVTDLTFDGNSGSFGAVTQANLVPAGIWARFVDGIRVLRCRAQNCLGDGFRMEFARNVSLEGVETFNVGQWPISAAKNGVNFIGDYVASGNWGYNYSLIGAKILATGTAAAAKDAEAIQVSGIYLLTIDDVVVDDCDYVIECAPTSITNGTWGAWTISNVVATNALGYFFVFGMGQSSGYTLEGVAIDNCVMSGHATLHDGGAIGLTSGNAAQIINHFHVSDCTFRNINTLDTTTRHWVDYQPANASGWNHFSIEDCDFFGKPGSTRTGNEIGIVARAPMSNVRVEHCHLHDVPGRGVHVSDNANLASPVISDVVFTDVFIDGANDCGFRAISASATGTGTIQNVRFVNCVAKDTSKVTTAPGFQMNITQAGATIKRIYFEGCRAYRTAGVTMNFGLTLLRSAGTVDEISIIGCDFQVASGSDGIFFDSGATNVRLIPIPGLGPAITAAATIQAPVDGNVFLVNGNTNITNGITVRVWDKGRTVVLVFTGTPTVSDTGTSRLSAAFVATADDTLTLACDGTNWYEVARSAN